MGVRLAAWTLVAAAFAALAYGSQLGDAPKREPDVFYTWELFAAGVAQVVLTLGIALAIAAGAFGLFALRRPASWRRALGLMAVVIVATWVVGGVVTRLGGDPGREQGLVPEAWDPDRIAPFAANALLVVVLAPLTEELFFRGLGYSLLERFGALAAIVVTAALFALAHGLVTGLPILFLLGAGLAFLRARTGSVVPGLLLHAAFNAISLVLGIVT